MSALKSFVVAFACLAVSTAVSAWAQDEPRSGIVKPKVTIIKPSTFAEGPLGAALPDAHESKSGMDPGDPVIEDFNLPTKYGTPFAITTDSKGIIWFTEMTAHTIARLNPANGELKEYRLPSTEGLPDAEWDYDPQTKLTTPEGYNIYSVGNPAALTVDKNDVIWFVTLLGNSVARFDPVKEEFTEFMIPTDHAQPYDLAVDSTGRIWFVEKNSGKMGYLDMESKKMVEIGLGHNAGSMGIAVDAYDKVWIGDVAANRLGRYDPKTGKLRAFDINVPNSQPGQMRFDYKGNLWTCMLHSQQLGVLIIDRDENQEIKKGIYSVVPLPGYNAVPQALAPDKQGRIWIVDSMTNQIGFFDSINLKWRLFDIPTANSQPMGITIDPSGDVWFTQSDRHANRISRLKVSTIKEQKAQPAPADSVAKASKSGGVSMTTIILLTLVVILVAGAGMFAIRKMRP